MVNAVRPNFYIAEQQFGAVSTSLAKYQARIAERARSELAGGAVTFRSFR